MSAGALAIISIVWLETSRASPMPTENMVVPLALIAAAVSIATRSPPKPSFCWPSVSSQIIFGMLELTLEVAFLSNVSPERRPAEMYVSPWANMLRMDAVSAARFALNGIEIWWVEPEVLRRDGTKIWVEVEPVL
jgi:hypothetical protein